MKLVDFLSTFSTAEAALAALTEKYAIHVNRHGKYPNLVQLKYDQLDSPMSNELVRECRGIILDSTDNWKVISNPFGKFFNYDDGGAAKIDWSKAKGWEKVDGSLMHLYLYDDEWQIASSGLPDASGFMDKTCTTTFAMKFWEVWSELGYALPVMDGVFTYIFEMATAMNEVIVPQVKSRIVFIGIRNLITGIEYDIDEFDFGWEKPARFPLTSLEHAIKESTGLNPMLNEGFVVYDGKNRIKIKSPSYVAISHLGMTREEIVERGLNLEKYDESTQRRWMLQIILTNESDEFLAYFPQYRAMYASVKAAYERAVKEAEALYEAHKDLNQFLFAAKVKDHPLSGSMFIVKAGRIPDIKTAIRGMKLKNLHQIISKKV